MKKMIKMSLVAAVAVTGLSSTVAAKPLAEAIKDVDVSGSVVYRYNDYSDDKATGTHKNYYKIGTTLKSKVNDIVTATVRVVTGTGVADNDANFAAGGLDTTDGTDANPTLQVNQANFTAKVAGATVIAGKQGLTTPWTVAVDTDSNEQTGTGLLALVPAGPVTIAAAAFNQTNLNNVKPGVLAGGALNGAADIMTLGVIGKAGAVSFDAWYLDMEDTFDTMTVGAKAKIAMVTADVRYTTLDLDAVNTDNSALMAKFSAKFGKISAYTQLGMTDSDGGLTALDSDAKTTFTGWNVNMHDKQDADFVRFGAGMDVMAGLNVAVNYATQEYKSAGAKVEESELYTQITHKMGKNLSTYVRLGTYEKETSSVTNNDKFTGRLQVQYTF